MTRVGSRELKNRLGSFLARVGRGETILVTHRGKPIAKLSPVKEDAAAVRLEALLRQMEAEGHIRLATGTMRASKPVSAKGRPASRIILEERE